MFSLIPPQFKIAALVGLLLSSFLGGWYVCNKFNEASASELLRKEQQERRVIEDSNKKAVIDLQTNEETLRQAYINVSEELIHAKGKVTTVPCTVTNTGVRVWDDANTGTVSKDPTGTPSEAKPTSDTSAEEPKQAISVEDLFENMKENAEICNGMRQQIEAIIKWSEEVQK